VAGTHAPELKREKAEGTEMRTEIEIDGVRGTLTIGTSTGANGRPPVLWWELQTDNANTGGTCKWVYRAAMGGKRYVLELWNGTVLEFELTVGRLGPGMPEMGPTPPQPWFVRSDRGNGRPVDPNRGRGPERLKRGFSWTVRSVQP
jgi:hypothetical protein